VGGLVVGSRFRSSSLGPMLLGGGVPSAWCWMQMANESGQIDRT
jgi:hypothetical protein